MKKRSFLILGVVLTLFLSVFESCLDDNDSNKNIFQFIYEPVLIKSEDGNITMRTQYGDILAPQLSQANSGEYYLTNFLMDTTIHPYKAFGLEYKQMGADTLSIASDETTASEEYNVPISDIKIYLKDPHADDFLKDNVHSIRFICIDSTFFVNPVFEGRDREKVHELRFFINTTVDPVADTPVTLYIAAKETNKEISRSAYALNISTAFKKDAQASDDEEVEFNLKFKTGVDSEGNDVYMDYKGNPVKLKIK